MKQILHSITALTMLLAGVGQGADVYDVVVYGGTPGGITSAISASREGLSVVLLEQSQHVGGLSTSGLNRDELEHMDQRTMGGLSEQFLNEAARLSRVPPKPEGFVIRGPRVWQSHIAEKVFLEMLDKSKVPVRYGQLLEGVTKENGRITVLKVRGGTSYQAKVFIDATYEGDLMAAAGVSYALGREARDTYGEMLGGVRYLDPPVAASPYDEQGRLLPGIMPGPPPAEFSASSHPMGYNIRLNLSTNPDNSVSIEKPEGYDPVSYELLARSLASGTLQRVGQVIALYGMPGGKKECNNGQFSIISLNMPGEQTAWAEASFEEREAIHRKFRNYTHGLLWFLKSDPRVPQAIRDEMAGYGFCKDEWVDNGHWPHYLYIRVARRMKSDCILTQKDITEARDKADVIHIGSHYIDSHHITRYAVDKDHFINEGRIWEKGNHFDIPYRAITPKAEECKNLLVPVCVSSSAVAFCAIRLEPTWMHLGEVSGMAASLAIRGGKAVQDIDIKQLQGNIVKAGIPLEVPDPANDAADAAEAWSIDTTDEWKAAAASSEGISLKDGMATPDEQVATLRSVVRQYSGNRRFGKMTLTQSPAWQNWEPVGKVGPSNIEDAPVFLARCPGDYWLFGLYRNGKGQVGKTGIQEHGHDFKAQPATLKGYDVPLMTTPFPNQWDAPGGLKPSLGGYHAWQSKDMVHWVHHGPVTEKVSQWVTTAEQVGGKTYIYYDYPNDQDPHLFIDDDLTDGLPGKNMNLAFRNPTDGSDCTFIRDAEGKFHVIYEDWSPINAKAHSWDSPLAGHAVSADGIKDFKIFGHAVDQRTKPTGRKGTYEHPHWMQHPDWKTNIGEYEIHEPEQNAFGDWAAISIGGQYYLFCDYHPAGEKIRIGWFTSNSIDKPFTFCGEIGQGHPDPDIGFAEGKFYLINQTASDYVSPGPWVEAVEVRAGVDTTGDGVIDVWTGWKEVKETYDHIDGFSKRIKRNPAELDLSGLPASDRFGFELRIRDTTSNPSTPILDAVRVSFQ